MQINGRWFMERDNFYFEGPHPLAHTTTTSCRWLSNNWKECGKLDNDYDGLLLLSNRQGNKAADTAHTIQNHLFPTANQSYSLIAFLQCILPAGVPSCYRHDSYLFQCYHHHHHHHHHTKICPFSLSQAVSHKCSMVKRILTRPKNKKKSVWKWKIKVCN